MAIIKQIEDSSGTTHDIPTPIHQTSGTASFTATTSATNNPSINSRQTASDRYYGIEMDKNGKMYVNVPWVNSTGFASTTHKHTVAHTPSGSNSSTKLTPAGTVTSTFAGTAASHNHSFTGSESSVDIEYTPAGSVSSHSHTPTKSTTNVYSLSAVGTLPSCTLPVLSGSISSKCLALSWSAGSFSAGTLPTKGSAQSVLTNVTIGNTTPTFTGTKATLEATLTPSGTIGNKSITPVGTVSSTFSGTQDSGHTHTFTGTAATLTSSTPTT